MSTERRLEEAHRALAPLLGQIALCLAARRVTQRRAMIDLIDRSATRLQELRALLAGETERA